MRTTATTMAITALVLVGCSTSTTGEAGSAGGESAPSPGSTSDDGTSHCDLHRDGWCTCGPKSIWDESKAIASCTGYSCCYRFTRSGASYSECACSNEIVSCAQTAASAHGVVVSSCPDGAATTSSSSSGSGSSSSGGGTCGEPCSAGCCSTTGLICCKPPFCDGNCAGSPCC